MHADILVHRPVTDVSLGMTLSLVGAATESIRVHPPYRRRKFILSTPEASNLGELPEIPFERLPSR
jgi:hypothetical protein